MPCRGEDKGVVYLQEPAIEFSIVSQGGWIVKNIKESIKLHSIEVKVGDVFVFPKGMLHFL